MGADFEMLSIPDLQARPVPGLVDTPLIPWLKPEDIAPVAAFLAPDYGAMGDRCVLRRDC